MHRPNSRSTRTDPLFQSYNWYTPFFEYLNLTSSDSIAKNVKVITFNYDRSLERFLHGHIIHSIDDEFEDIAIENLKQLEIIHPHGCFGSYPDVPYGFNLNESSDVELVASRIRIISDEISNSKPFLATRRVIAQAKPYLLHRLWV